MREICDGRREELGGRADRSELVNSCLLLFIGHWDSVMAEIASVGGSLGAWEWEPGRGCACIVLYSMYALYSVVCCIRGTSRVGHSLSTCSSPPITVHHSTPLHHSLHHSPSATFTFTPTPPHHLLPSPTPPPLYDLCSSRLQDTILHIL